MPELKPLYQLWGKDVDDKEPVLLASYWTLGEAEEDLPRWANVDYTALEIRKANPCPKCGAVMVIRLVGSHDGSGAKRFWECAACKHNEPVEEIG